jgi:hypothetical protein
VVPYPTRSRDLIGALRDKIVVKGDIVSTESSWDADAES